jgi:hypothetical protein
LSISYVTGSLGMGKSMYGARSIGRALLHGKVVICNIKLLEGWEKTVLSHNPYYKFGSSARKKELKDDLYRRFIYEDDVDRIIRAKIHGRGEGRGLMVLDEAHSNFNNRNWANEIQRDGLRQMAMARHRGWEVLVISQHKDNTDMAIRRIAANEIQMTNWQKLTRIPFLGTPMLPVPVFLALGFRMNTTRGVVKSGKPFMRQLFTAGWFRNLYDTFEEYEEDDSANVIWLPLGEGERYVSRKKADSGEPALLLPGESGFTSSPSPPLPEPRRPLPLPSDESRTSTPLRPAATSVSEA